MGVDLWIKQYGLERSGTNYVKALLELSCPDVRVLATVLGSKHAPPDLEQHVDRLAHGDVGIAVTDLGESDWQSVVESYRRHDLAVLLCVRDPITWIDAYERHRAKREKRPAVVLGRHALEVHVEQWLAWVADMQGWSRMSPLRVEWAVHHEIVRNPQALVDLAAAWGSTGGNAVPVGYTRKAGDHHGSQNVTQRSYAARQYREIYQGLGQISADDVAWVRSLVEERDDSGLARRFLWDGRPLRRRQGQRDERNLNSGSG